MEASRLKPLRIAALNPFPSGTEGRVIDDLVQGLRTEGIHVDLLDTSRSLLRCAHLTSIRRCDVLIVHTPLAYAPLHVLWARMLRKPVVSLVWDIYPVKLGGQRYDKRVRRRLIDWLENGVIALSTHLFVPSRDFLVVPRLARAHVMMFWHTLELNPNRDQETVSLSAPEAAETGRSIRVIFAGQANATRGLPAAYAALKAQLGKALTLVVASPNPLPDELQGEPAIVHLGNLDRPALRAEMAKCDVGLVALAMTFDGPGFPSKTYEYLAAGLPCIYFGKRLDHYTNALIQSGAGVVIGVDAANALSPSNLRALKRHIARSARVFAANFELDSKAFASRLRAIVSDKQL